MHPDLEWQRRYAENDTPWDKGTAAPPLLAYIRSRSIIGRILVPGCGRGHEVRVLGRQAQATVVGMDLAETAVVQARQLAATSGSPDSVSFVQGDFFQLPQGFQNAFDWVVEHTCFCAIEPYQRSEYVKAAAQALKPGGHFFGIFYISPDTESGPPFKVSPKELSGLFDPHFSLMEEWVPIESFPGRENRELVRVLQKQ